MAKTNIIFNNKTYSIDESSLSSATAALRQHLSTTMSGSGATINFDETAYNVDSTKLQTATNGFVSHLRTITGSGSKVMVNGVEYGIDSAKVADAISELEAVFGGVGEERLEGDGAEYYTLAPTTLSFRSTAPLNELQEVQINGVTVAPSNYTLEEGSTIVTFPIEYMKTLDKGDYEIAIVSDSKTVKGNFTVVAPDLNAHGFYYNQPYTAYVSMFSENEAFFIREDGTIDIIGVPSADVQTGTYTADGNNLTVSCSLGTLTGTVSTDGTEIYCHELGITFVLGNESIVADEDFIYIYKEDLGGYEVTAIDKTKSSYGAIKTGINGKPTVALASEMFYENDNLVTAPEIPDSVKTIGDLAFFECTNLTNIDLSGVTSIGIWAFSGCTNLTTVNLGNVTSIGSSAFYKCTSLTDIDLSNVETISGYAFNGCTNLTTVNLGNVTSIGNYAFFGCTNLTDINLSNVTSISGYAFDGCTNLTTVNLGNVTSIGDYAFDGCTNLTDIDLSNVETIGNCAFDGCTSLKDVYYTGSEADWAGIEIGSRNECLTNATIHYNYGA